MAGTQDALLRELWAQVRALRAEVSDLRVEISEMEATVADLVERADEPDRAQLPWPVSLLLLPAALTLALIRQVDELARALTTECDPGRKELPEAVRETP
ncbi:hypothetical protein IU448_15665 [Nocardia flavorosea]|uniref:hypothetical protein n=1 Tax=Nocardia flavorosea TaxID=53429 RepID=UPI00189550C0|nr:hypothetical protein [Nocardia flavorosea]MBF6350442.1 hypothetical protein [Nocardia flavorosea]